jgi:hypothetical protein
MGLQWGGRCRAGTAAGSCGFGCLQILESREQPLVFPFELVDFSLERLDVSKVIPV